MSPARIIIRTGSAIGIVFLPLLLACAPDPGTESEGPPATASEQLVQRSIDLHDPDRIWGSVPLRLDWRSTDPEGRPWRLSDVRFDDPEGVFELTMEHADGFLEYRTEGDSWSATVDGSSEIPPEIFQGFRLHRDDGMFWRNYYAFLAGLPMKLLDPGVHLDPEPATTTLADRLALEVRVKYDQDVGTDTWWMYFDPESAQLLGARFEHATGPEDGETILMRGLVEGAGLRLPRVRHWTMTLDGRPLGADSIASVGVGEKP